MRRLVIAITVCGAAIAGCSSNPHPSSAAPVAAPASTAATNVNMLEGAAVDAPIPGLAGAAWADPNNTGYVTGYKYKGQYHVGAPPGYDPAQHAVIPPH